MFEELLKLIRSRYPNEKDIPLHAPSLDQSDRAGVMEAFDTGFVSSVGPHVTKFEEDLARICGAKKAIAVVNGTAALHLAMIMVGAKPGDAVITQALTFVATANAISYIGASPVFIDSDMDTLGMSPTALENFLTKNAIKKADGAFLRETNQRISACVPMHVFGHPVRLKELLKICREWSIPLVEDAAEGLGSTLEGEALGGIADVGVLSFNGNKIVTTGGGGAILFRDEKLAAKAKHLSTTAKQPHAWNFFHDEIGYNYRLPNLNAALGCAQLKKLESFLAIKQGIAQSYEVFFSQYPEAKFISARPGTQPNFWLNAVLLKDRATRDQWLKDANAHGIMMRPVWELMPDLPMFANCLRDDLLVARDITNRLINLPSGVPQ